MVAKEPLFRINRKLMDAPEGVRSNRSKEKMKISPSPLSDKPDKLLSHITLELLLNVR